MYRSMGRSGSDETAPGHVTGYVSRYLSDFVIEVLSSYPDEWGYIRSAGFGSLEYSHSKLIGTIPDSWFYIPVHYILCSGGWSNMDYYVY